MSSLINRIFAVILFTILTEICNGNESESVKKINDQLTEFKPNNQFNIRLNYLSRIHFYDVNSSFIKISFLVTKYDKFKPLTKVILKITDENNKEIFNNTIPEKYYFEEINFSSAGIHKISFINGGKTGIQLNVNIEQGKIVNNSSNYVKKEHLNDTKTLIDDIEDKMVSFKSILEFKQKSNKNRFKNLLDVNKYYLMSAIIETVILIIICFLQIRYIKKLKI